MSGVGQSLPASRRCEVCGRRLKHPTSIAAGIGPTCAGKAAGPDGELVGQVALNLAVAQ